MIMEDWENISKQFFEQHIKSFTDLTDKQKRNFDIKKNHSYRVTENSVWLAGKLELEEQHKNIAFVCGLLHDIGRFTQLVKYDTFNDGESFDHAVFSVKIIKESEILKHLDEKFQQLVFNTIEFHNHIRLPKKLTEPELLHAQLLRDADKLDILNVLTDYYSNKNQNPNHTLMWDLPKGSAVSKEVAAEALAGKIVTREKVANQIDIKIMQLSWVYDFNFKPSFEYILEHRFLEKIYNTLSKTDTIIEIYRKAKVYAENKIFG